MAHWLLFLSLQGTEIPACYSAEDFPSLESLSPSWPCLCWANVTACSIHSYHQAQSIKRHSGESLEFMTNFQLSEDTRISNSSQYDKSSIYL